MTLLLRSATCAAAAAVQAGVHWSRAFTAKLTEEVKLVGSTISCEPADKPGVAGKERRSVHVQSYAVATDQVRQPHRLVGRPARLHLILRGLVVARCCSPGPQRASCAMP